jgi:hypothetical protein
MESEERPCVSVAAAILQKVPGYHSSRMASAARNGMMELLQSISMYTMIWIHLFHQGRMNREPIETLSGQLKILGPVAFSIAINTMIGISGYFGVKSPRLNVRRLS